MEQLEFVRKEKDGFKITSKNFLDVMPEEVLQMPKNYKIARINQRGNIDDEISLIMDTNQMVMGVNKYLDRLYVGKIGNKHVNEDDIETAEMVLFYRDFKLSKVEYKRYQGWLYINALSNQNEEIGFIVGDGSSITDSSWPTYLPQSSGNIFSHLPDTSEETDTLINQLYILLGIGLKENTDLFSLIETFIKISQSSSTLTEESDFDHVYSEYQKENSRPIGQSRCKIINLSDIRKNKIPKI